MLSDCNEERVGSILEVPLKDVYLSCRVKETFVEN